MSKTKQPTIEQLKAFAFDLGNEIRAKQELFEKVLLQVRQLGEAAAAPTPKPKAKGKPKVKKSKETK